MPLELLASIEDDIVGVETQDAIDIVTVTGLGVGDLQLADRPPQLSPTGRPEALAPGNPRRPQPHASSATCPARALPRYALPRAAAAGRGCVLGTPPSPRASSGRRRRRARGERWQRRGKMPL